MTCSLRGCLACGAPVVKIIDPTTGLSHEGSEAARDEYMKQDALAASRLYRIEQVLLQNTNYLASNQETLAEIKKILS